MKKTDIAMIILIASVSVMISFFTAKAIFGDVDNQGVKVKTIERISADVSKPSTKIFNKNAINPSVKVEIENTNATTQ